jgi:DedD protein
VPEPVPEAPVAVLPEPEEPEVQPRVATPTPHLPATEPPKPAPKPLATRPAAVPAPSSAERPRAVARADAGSPKPAVTAWAIQVGSFSERTNADKLVQELRAARYPAFQEATEVQGNTLYRVRVGPEADRELADAMAEGIAKRFKLNGRVVSYP